MATKQDQQTDENMRLLGRLLQAKSDEEITEIIDSEPALSSPEFTAFLQEQERRLRQEGRAATADALGAMYENIHALSGLRDLDLPDRAGVDVASSLVAALIGPAREAAVPPSAISDALYLVTGTLREHLATVSATNKALVALHELDDRIAAVASQMDKKQRRQARDFLATMQLWLECESWEESKAVLAAHRELFSADSVAILQILLQGTEMPEDDEEQKRYQQHLDILASVPAEGMDAVYERLIADEERQEAQAGFRDEFLDAWFAKPSKPDLLGIELRDTSEQLHLLLDRLEAALSAPAGKRPNYHAANASGLRWTSGTFAAEDVPRAEDLYLRAVQTGGSGLTYVEEGLLPLIGSQEDASVLPFLAKVLDISRPRDSFAKQRQRLALACIARIAIAQKSAAAVQALRDLTRHSREGVRSNAVYYLGQVFLFRQEPVPADVQAELTTVAMDAADFASRYNARNVLRYCQLPIPSDVPDGVFVFKVDYLGSGYKSVTNVSRTIEALSSQTLEDLSYAILDSVSFDSDHLHAFYLTADERDARFEVDSSESRWGMGPVGPVDMMWGGGQSAPLTDAEATLGELGLRPRHKFSYLFDFGDDHEFNIQVAEVRPTANKRAKYPRVTARHGRAPQQYPSYE